MCMLHCTITVVATVVAVVAAVVTVEEEPVVAAETLKPPPLAGAGAGADNRVKRGSEGREEGRGERRGGHNMLIGGMRVMLIQYNARTCVRMY